MGGEGGAESCGGRAVSIFLLGLITGMLIALLFNWLEKKAGTPEDSR